MDGAEAGGGGAAAGGGDADEDEDAMEAVAPSPSSSAAVLSSSPSSSSSAPPLAPVPASVALGGWLGSAPPNGPPFCKWAYGCPVYIWHHPWWGVAYDLWSVGATLFRAAEGLPLYQRPFLFDSAFAMLLPPPGAAPPGSPPLFGDWFRRRHGHAPPASSGEAPSSSSSVVAARRLSRELVELVISLLRVSPFERPLSAADVLRHPFFAQA